MAERTAQEEAYLFELKIRTQGQISSRELDYSRLLELRANTDRDTLPGEREDIENRLSYCNSF